MWPGPHGQHRRTELFRSDALRRFGFVVHETVYSQVALPRCLLLIFSWKYPLQSCCFFLGNILCRCSNELELDVTTKSAFLTAATEAAQ